MKYLCILLCVTVIGCLTAEAVVITGFAYLNDESNHADIQITFEAVTPPAVSDSVMTGGTGYFIANLTAGEYHIRYSHEEYGTYRIPNQTLNTNTTLDSQTLYWALTGNLSGSIGPGTYHVRDSIAVRVGATLTIQPGTRLLFESRQKFMVRGTLYAIGTPQDSIIFTRRTASPDSLWGGIRMIQVMDASQMFYCAIEFARSPGNLWEESGGGLMIAFCGPRISECSIRWNEGGDNLNGGAGIYCHWATPLIDHCLITQNTTANSAIGNGAGIVCNSGTPRIENCLITQNTAWQDGGGIYLTTGSTAIVEHCEITENVASNGRGGGIAAHSHAFIRNSRIMHNTAHSGGGISTQIGPEISGCLISANIALQGGGMYFEGSTATMKRCTIVDNQAVAPDTTVIARGDAAYYDHTLANLNTCILSSNAGHEALYFIVSPDAWINFTDLFTGDGPLYRVYDNDTTNAPDALGEIGGNNANGDTCDGYFNIPLDPEFSDPSQDDYRLLAGSPCIDAGDPVLPHDPDGSLADMGAYYAGWIDGANDELPVVRQFELLQNYPNPFNSSTQIVFDLPRAGGMELAVFDVTGRLVQTLAAQRMEAGRHEVMVDASNWSSGIYFYRLQSEGIFTTRKMVLMK